MSVHLLNETVTCVRVLLLRLSPLVVFHEYSNTSIAEELLFDDNFGIVFLISQ